MVFYCEPGRNARESYEKAVTALKITELYDLSHTAAGDYLAGFTYPWQALEGLKDFILALGPKLPKEEYEEREPNVWVHKSAKVFPSAYLGAPCIIGPDTEVRHCAFIRAARSSARAAWWATLWS